MTRLPYNAWCRRSFSSKCEELISKVGHRTEVYQFIRTSAFGATVQFILIPVLVDFNSLVPTVHVIACQHHCLCDW